MHTFDPTGDSVKYAQKVAAAGAEFHAWGLAGAVGEMVNSAAGANVSNPLLPLGDVVTRLGHAGRHIDILKIDCEVGQGAMHAAAGAGGRQHATAMLGGAAAAGCAQVGGRRRRAERPAPLVPSLPPPLLGTD